MPRPRRTSGGLSLFTDFSDPLAMVMCGDWEVCTCPRGPFPFLEGGSFSSLPPELRPLTWPLGDPPNSQGLQSDAPKLWKPGVAGLFLQRGSEDFLLWQIVS